MSICEYVYVNFNLIIEVRLKILISKYVDMTLQSRSRKNTVIFS